MAVARQTQIIGASPHSWEDAVRNALERAGKIVEYRATLLVTFVLDK
jgi:flavin-binding protein dodecin